MRECGRGQEAENSIKEELSAKTAKKGQGKTKAEFLDEKMRKIGILAGRWASMEEVTDAVVFLASDRARYINGIELPVDGT